MKPTSRNLLIISLAVVFAYLLIFPDRLAVEPEVSIGWFQPSHILGTLPGLKEGEAATGLYTADSVAFVGNSGERAGIQAAPEATSLAGKRLALLDSPNRTVEIRDVNGGVLARLPGMGAPYFSGDSLAVVGEGASSLQLYTASGESRWRFDTPDLITAYCAAKDGDSFLAFAGGTISWLDSQGNTRLSWRPGTGRVPIIYGMLWIESRKILAVVTDLDPQTLVLLRPSGAAAKSPAFELVETVTLPRATRTPVWMQAELGDSLIVIEQQDGIGLLSLDQAVRTIVPLGGHPDRVIGLDDARVLVCLVSTPAGNRLVGIKPDGRKLFTQDSSLRAYDLAKDSQGRILVSNQGGITSLRLEAK